MPASRADPSGYRQKWTTVNFLVQPLGGGSLFSTLLSLLLLCPHVLRATPLTFNSIQFWTGAGTNRAAMVIQWNDGETPASLVWGYRWNGVATGFDMFRSIAGSTSINAMGSPTNTSSYTGADIRLATSWTEFGFGKALDSVVFNSGESSRSRADWTTGFWEYQIFGGQFNYDLYDSNWNFIETTTYVREGSDTYTEVAWFSSPIGSSDRNLIDGSWDAWSFADNFAPAAIIQPTAAPPSPPACKSIRRISPSEIELVFTTTIGISYQLESKGDLGALTWTANGSPRIAASGEAVFIITISPQTEKEFYQLRQLP